jgi:hypothetical protein
VASGNVSSECGIRGECAPGNAQNVASGGNVALGNVSSECGVRTGGNVESGGIWRQGMCHQNVASGGNVASEWNVAGNVLSQCGVREECCVRGECGVRQCGVRAFGNVASQCVVSVRH